MQHYHYFDVFLPHGFHACQISCWWLSSPLKIPISTCRWLVDMQQSVIIDSSTQSRITCVVGLWECLWRVSAILLTDMRISIHSWWPHSWVWSPRMNKKEKASWAPTCINSVLLNVGTSHQCPHSPATVTSLLWWTGTWNHELNKPFLLQVAYVRIIFILATWNKENELLICRW